MRTLFLAAFTFGLMGTGPTLTGGAEAQTQPKAVTASTLYFAVVDLNGAKRRSTDGVRSKRLNTGQYQVLFGANVSKCAYSATIGSPTTTPTQGGSAKVASLAGKPRGVLVQTGQSGSAVDRPFHLIVLCP